MTSTETIGIAVVLVVLALATYFFVSLFSGDTASGPAEDLSHFTQKESDQETRRINSIQEESEGQAAGGDGAFAEGADQGREKVEGTTRHATITGRTVDEKGKPVSGATITLHRGGTSLVFYRPAETQSEAQGTSGNDGRFELVVPHEGGEFTVIARHPDFSEAFYSPLNVRLGDGARVPDMVLGSGTIVNGLVSDFYGNPIEGAQVRIEDPIIESALAQAGEAQRLTTATGPSGIYRFEDLSLRTFKISASAKGYSTQQVSSNLLFEKAREKVINFKLTKGRSIAGQVVDQESRPVGSAEIKATLYGGKEYSSFGCARSGPEGDFSVDDLAEGAYTVRITCEGYTEVVKSKITAGTQGLEVVLKKRGGVSGLVMDGQSRAPVNDFRIRVMERNRVGNKETMMPTRTVKEFKTKDGRYSIENLDPGSCFLLVSSSGYADCLSSEVVIARDQVKENVDIYMNQGGDLRGRVVNGAGAPVQGAKITLSDSAEQDDPFSRALGAMMNSTIERSKKTTVTDETGSFLLTLITPGRYGINATHPDYARGSPRSVNVEPGAGATPQMEDMVLTEGARVFGRVLDNKKNPVSSAIVAITNSKGFMERTTTEADGSYQFRHLKAGEYTVFWQINTSENRDIESLFKNLQNVEGTKTTLVVREGGEERVDIYLQ
ncbi:MAG: carboxypeptidase-like regulatory domain-containing protein [Planctomycetota bacterium]